MNKYATVADGLNAAHFINCSDPSPEQSHYIQECPYPELFSIETKSCQDFRMVPTDSRMVPQAPCEYSQFHCNKGNISCKPCPEVHHSCVGLPDGDNAISGFNWTSVYITCLLNRTMAEKACESGVFDPQKRICTTSVILEKIIQYCSEYPYAILKHPENCGWYYNCSAGDQAIGKYIEECRYPKLFSTITKRCEDFKDVYCSSRHEPQAPCEYVKNICPLSEQNCIPCPVRLPSCIGLPDGLNAIPGNLWSTKYLRCRTNRTIGIFECKEGFFNPYKRLCVDKISPTFVSEFCKTNQAAVVASSINCAQFINCAKSNEGFILECKYPNLFSASSRKCQTFTEVKCGGIIEPQAPCSYKQNLCLATDSSCLPCTQRLPSCVGLDDGYHGFFGQEWYSKYFQCYKNRTIDILNCNGYFDPSAKKCVDKILPENVNGFCKYHPSSRLPSWINCAQYYDCSMRDSIYQPYLHECTYPQLFSLATLQCEDFHHISCGVRTEPMTPCQYLQNQCSVGDSNCIPCPARLPSCLTLPDGVNPYPGKQHSTNYILCDRNRTLSVETCPFGYFDTASKRCIKLESSTVCVVTLYGS
ncbi:uncharacterized protein LOC134276045 [Saccostrea cucullata]|uniref:uncharacterized protein LOC134276045 n=1 Tax=Saccostrea cuccullata TaxID=36930 RepID=UPI002ED17D44